MTKTQDFTAVFKDFLAAFPVDTKAMEDAFKNQAALSEKLSGVALSAAEQSAEISNKWTKETLAKLSEMAKAKTEPADYAKAMTDFASSQGALAQEYLNQFAQIAQALQEQTISILMEASSSMGEEAAEAVQKAADMMGMKGPGSK